MSVPSEITASAPSLPVPVGPPVDQVMNDDPRRELMIGGAVVLVFFVLFLGWASFARLDAAAYAPGQISVEGHRQTVQHRDGGTISGIKVKEGQHVQAGQVLVELAPRDVAAAEGSMASQVISLEAQRARLLAESAGQTTMAAPREFAALTGDDKVEAEGALRQQQAELRARVGAIASQKAVLRQRNLQLTEQIKGYTDQIGTTDQQSKLINDELAGTQALADKGYASINRVRALQRTAAGLTGSRADLASNAARAKQAQGETQMQSIGLDTQHQQDVAKDLRDAEYQLNDLLPKLRALKEQLAGVEIRSPATGQVVGLAVNTVGGVIAPGQKILDVVPDKAPLVFDARLSPNDADDVYVGQATEVKITSLHERDIPILKGTLTRVSADAFSDEKTGQSYYTIQVTVPEEELARIQKLKGRTDSLKPGLPAQVLIPLRKRSALQYLTEPLTQSIWKSFREH